MVNQADPLKSKPIGLLEKKDIMDTKEQANRNKQAQAEATNPNNKSQAVMEWLLGKTIITRGVIHQPFFR